jgi:hypothetical protein
VEGLQRTLDWFRERKISARPEAALAGDPNW